MEKLYSCNNMHCAACKANIENELKKVDGVVEVEANTRTYTISDNMAIDSDGNMMMRMGMSMNFRYL